MTANLLALIALDVARERAREGERRARLLPVAPARPSRPGVARRHLARMAVRIGRAADGLARRLDERAALTDVRSGS